MHFSILNFQLNLLSQELYFPIIRMERLIFGVRQWEEDGH